MYLEITYCRYDAAARHLYFTLPWFRPAERVRVRSWSEGCLVDTEKNGGWVAEAEAIDLPVCSDLLTGGDSDHPIACYARSLPQEVVRGLAAFSYDQLAMLQVCAASPRGQQLLQCAPQLLWLIAPTLLRKSGGKSEAVHDLLGLRQQDLLALHCGRGSKGLVRLIAKLPAAVHYTNRRVLTAILAREEAISLLRHKRKAPWQLLNLIARQGDKINTPLVRGIIRSDMDITSMVCKLDEMNRIVSDTMRLGRQLGIVDALSLIAACTEWRMLSTLHNAWTERLNRTELDEQTLKYGEFLPPPPLPGTEVIQPIDSVRELLQEGKVMHHCVGGYIDRVRSGACYIYRIMAPERATLEIRQIQPGFWVQGQLQSHCNGTPCPEVFRQVQAWLNVKLEEMILKSGEFLPPPPLPGTEVIQPIDSVRELLQEEGKIMHHYVGSYIDPVRSGTCYIYRIMAPERATLEIHRSRGVWVQGELKTHCNGTPSPEVFRQVEAWLIEHKQYISMVQ